MVHRLRSGVLSCDVEEDHLEDHAKPSPLIEVNGDYYMVFFKDKEGTPYDVEAPEHFCRSEHCCVDKK